MRIGWAFVGGSAIVNFIIFMQEAWDVYSHLESCPPELEPMMPKDFPSFCFQIADGMASVFTMIEVVFTRSMQYA